MVAGIQFALHGGRKNQSGEGEEDEGWWWCNPKSMEWSILIQQSTAITLVNAKRQVLMCRCLFSWWRGRTVRCSRRHAFRRHWMVEWDSIERVEVNLNEFENRMSQKTEAFERENRINVCSAETKGDFSMSSAGRIKLWFSRSTRFYMCPTWCLISMVSAEWWFYR